MCQTIKFAVCSIFCDTVEFRPLASPGLILPWPKKRTILEIRGEKNAVPRVISWSIRRDQRRAKVADSRGSDLPCADRAWSSMISHVEQRSSRRESRWWFFFLARVVPAHFGDMVGLYTIWAYTRVVLYTGIKLLVVTIFLTCRSEEKKQAQEKNAANKRWNTGKTHKNVRREQRVGQFQSSREK